MTARRSLPLVLAAALIAPLAATSAFAGCTVGVDVADAATPQVIDRTGDWDGVVTGTEQGVVPGADLYREGIDITKAWIARDGSGAMTANIEVASLSTLQPNAIFYMLWSYAGTDAAKSRRWVSGRLKGYATAYSYGYMAVNPITGNTSFVTEGDTTGEIIEGTPGVVSVDIPSTGATLSGAPIADWGAPPSGATLALPSAESRFLVGSPEQLPPNPTGFRHGFVYVADTTANATTLCDAKIP